MHCPACNTHLRLIEAGGLQLDQCPDCHGVWFDRHELRPFMDFVLRHWHDVAEVEYDPEYLRDSIPGADEAEVPCPRCGVTMQKFNYAVDSNVVLDRCTQCEGLWGEQPEVPQLASFLKGNPAQDRLIAARAGMAGLHTAFREQMGVLRDVRQYGGKHRIRLHRKKW